MLRMEFEDGRFKEIPFSYDTGKLSRILIVPLYSEKTGLHMAEDINGFWYLLASFQRNPGVRFLYLDLTSEDANQLIKEGIIRGTAGYLGAFSEHPPKT